MSTLLLHLVGNKTLNRTIFPGNLFVYDDLVVFKKRRLFSTKEVTVSYSQISQVTLIKGLFFATLDVTTTGTDDIVIRFANKKLATQAKKIIDQKMYHSHAKHHDENANKKATPTHVEKSLARLHELFVQGHLSEKEYNKKRNALLNSL